MVNRMKDTLVIKAFTQAYGKEQCNCRLIAYTKPFENVDNSIQQKSFRLTFLNHHCNIYKNFI